MHNPVRPGEVIREACLKALDLSVTEAAKGLGVTRKALSELLNGHSGVSPEMAIRLEKAGWSTAETWLPMPLQIAVNHRAPAPHAEEVPSAAPPRQLMAYFLCSSAMTAGFCA